MVNIFFLLAQELCRYTVQAVRTQLVVSKHVRKHVEHNSSGDSGLDVLTLAVSAALEGCVPSRFIKSRGRARMINSLAGGENVNITFSSQLYERLELPTGICFRFKKRSLHRCHHSSKTPPFGELGQARILPPQSLRSVEEIWNIEVLDVVARQNVWVDDLDKLAPLRSRNGIRQSHIR